jgi:hypothetical protein
MMDRLIRGLVMQVKDLVGIELPLVELMFNINCQKMEMIVG